MQRLPLSARGFDTPLPHEVCSQLAELLRGNNDGGPFEPPRVLPVPIRQQIANYEQQRADEQEMHTWAAHPAHPHLLALGAQGGLYQIGEVQARCWTVLGTASLQHCWYSHSV